MAGYACGHEEPEQRATWKDMQRLGHPSAPCKASSEDPFERTHQLQSECCTTLGAFGGHSVGRIQPQGLLEC